MKLRTEIEKYHSVQPIGCRDGILILGSCFADNIGAWLSECRFDVSVNPFGVLYNPASIANNLQRTILQKPYTLEDDLHKRIIRHGNLYYSFDHHGQFYHQHPEGLCDMLNAKQEEVLQHLEKSQHILVTFGTSFVYETHDNVLVANCHKLPASAFSRRRLSVEEIVRTWVGIIDSLPEKHFIFTVSPIRHVKDSLHGNQLSKSILLLAIDELSRRYPSKVEYLPVYELFIDDLRDYRFYGEDLVHPSPLAISIVREYFTESCLTIESQNYLREIITIINAINHRPLHGETEEYRLFLSKNLLKIDLISEKYHIFTLSELKAAFQSRIESISYDI